MKNRNFVSVLNGNGNGKIVSASVSVFYGNKIPFLPKLETETEM